MSERLADALRLQSNQTYRLQDTGRGVTRYEEGQTLSDFGLRVDLRGYETIVFDQIEVQLERPVIDDDFAAEHTDCAAVDLSVVSTQQPEFEG